MTSLPLQQVQAQLAELIHRLAPGDELVITENDQPIARILPTLSSGAVDLRERGLDETMAADLRQRLKAFADDWDRPEMDVYDAV